MTRLPVDENGMYILREQDIKELKELHQKQKAIKPEPELKELIERMKIL